MSINEVFSKPGIRCAFYGRHSTDKQDMDLQRHAVETFAKEYDCEIITEYLDPAVSATKNAMEERKQLMRMMADAASNKFDAVLVYNRDRLARNAVEHAKIRSALELCHVPIVITSNRTLYNDGDLISQLVFDGLTRSEVEQTSIRMRDIIATNAKSGKWKGGKAPYGYSYNKKTGTFSIVEHEAAVVREIFDMYLQGQGFNSIAKHYGWKKANGEPYKEKVKAIITNPFYAGEVGVHRFQQRAHNSSLARHHWIYGQSTGIEPMITPEKWEACWRMYEEKSRGEISPKRFKTSFLLQGLVECGVCHQPMTGIDQRSAGKDKTYGKRIYKCARCKRTLNAEDLEDVIKHKVVHLVVTDKSKVETEVVKRLEEERDGLTEQIAGLEKEILHLRAEVDLAEEEMQKAVGARDTELFGMLQLYRLEQQEQITKNRALILDKTDKVNRLEQLDLRDVDWERMYRDVMKDTDDTMSLRRLMLHLIECVEVGSDGNPRVVRAWVGDLMD